MIKVKLVHNYNGNYAGETIEIGDELGEELVLIGLAKKITKGSVISKSLSTELIDIVKEAEQPVSPELIDQNKAIVPKYKKKK